MLCVCIDLIFMHLMELIRVHVLNRRFDRFPCASHKEDIKAQLNKKKKGKTSREKEKVITFRDFLMVLYYPYVYFNASSQPPLSLFFLWSPQKPLYVFHW